MTDLKAFCFSVGMLEIANFRKYLLFLQLSLHFFSRSTRCNRVLDIWKFVQEGCLIRNSNLTHVWKHVLYYKFCSIEMPDNRIWWLFKAVGACSLEFSKIELNKSWEVLEKLGWPHQSKLKFPAIRLKNKISKKAKRFSMKIKTWINSKNSIFFRITIPMNILDNGMIYHAVPFQRIWLFSIFKCIYYIINFPDIFGVFNWFIFSTSKYREVK